MTSVILRETIITKIPIKQCNTKIGLVGCGMVIGCEELVVGYSQEMIGLNMSGQPIINKSKLLPLLRGRTLS